MLESSNSSGNYTSTYSKDKILLNGAQKCAILMMILNEKEASRILRYLSSYEIKIIQKNMDSVKGLERETINLILDEFILKIKNHLNFNRSSSDYIKGVFTKALGGNAQAVLASINPSNRIKEKESLEEMDSRTIAEVLNNEHPQIVGLAMSYLDPEVASDVLKYYTKEKQADIMYRVAVMDKVSPDALAELERILRKKVSSNSYNTAKHYGIKSVANIMKYSKPEMEKRIMSSLYERDNNITELIKGKMYTFDHFILSDKNSLKNLISNIDIGDLSLSLKGANEDLRSKFFNCMSRNVAKNILNDIKEMGPVKISDIQSAQKRILNVAKKLTKEGSIIFVGSGQKDSFA